MFFFYIGIMTTYSGWISTYAVVMEVSEKEKATSYASIFWTSSTFFRFLTIYLFSGTISHKWRRMLQISIVFMAISCFIIAIQVYEIGIIFCGIFYGGIITSVIPFMFTLPSEFQMQIRMNQSSSIYVAGSMGEAFLSMVIGYLMAWISPNMLFFGLFLVTFAFYLIFEMTIN